MSEQEKLENLYKRINELMIHLGAEGEINTSDSAVVSVMDALFDIDEGNYDINRFKQFMKNLYTNKNQTHLEF